MDHFILTGDLVTNVPDIDAQHRELFHLANQVVDPACTDRGADYFQEVLGFLGQYIDYHFAAEELVMQRTRYPRAQLHRQWHDSFRIEVKRLIESARHEGVTKAFKLKLSFAIENWLLDHIRINDRQLAHYLTQELKLEVVTLPDLHALKNEGLLPAHYDARLWSGAALTRP